MEDTETYSENLDNDILNVISSGNTLEQWSDNPDVIMYLSELGSYGVQRLTQEPEKLSEEKAYILEQTQELAFHNYKTFIQTADCSREIFQDFNLIEHKLEHLLETIPNFNLKCQNFTEEAKTINTRWRQSSLMLSKHHQLLEILEIPQLMDTYVRNGYYEEALELAAYAKRLEKKHSDIPLIKSIVTQVQESQQLMLSLLLQLLRTNIKLPECLKVISHLRSMNIFDEAKLRIKFLQSRDAWFQSMLMNIPTNDPYNHITKVIELSRVNLFDIITLYRAVFGDDDDPLAPLSKDKPFLESNIFHSWINLKVTQFLELLENDLQGDLGGRLDSILSQSMYFGLSFSRVGADFRALLVPIFQQAILNNFLNAAQEAAKNFEDAMQSYNLTTLPTLSSAAMITSTLTTEDSIQPPMGLLEFPPLANYCNSILNAFNDLRLCAPLPLASPIANALQESLNRVVASTVSFYVAEKNSLTKPEESALLRFCTQFAHQMVPFLVKCHSILFPPENLAKVLGISLVEFKKMKVAEMNVDKLLNPMADLLPASEETDDDDEGIMMKTPILNEPEISESRKNSVVTVGLD